MSMVACLSCKSVVWAYDHETQPVAGLMNSMHMPCGYCGALGNFDGWNSVEGLSWADMHEIAESQGFAWRADGNNYWFGDKTKSEPATIGQLIDKQWLDHEVEHVRAFRSFIPAIDGIVKIAVQELREELIRHHHLIDHPESQGGTNRTNPTETFPDGGIM